MAGIDAYTVLMLHCDGADASTTFVDSSSGAKTMTANANAQIDTAQSKFGGASGLFDGAGDSVTTPDSADWDFGSNPFTIDFWVRHAATTSIDYVYSWSSSSGWIMGYAKGATLKLRIYDDGSIAVQSSATWEPVVDTWYHVAFVRNGNNFYMFIDGVQLGTTQDVTGITFDGHASAALAVGGDNGNLGTFNGWMDEVRISKGIARWTSDFTPPAAAYSADAPSINTWFRGGIALQDRSTGLIIL